MSTGLSRTKRDRIVEELHDLIFSGELERGSWLRQEELAQRFDTSITPVREALRLLESQGLVIGEAHRGVRIAGIDAENLKATYVMRRLVEPYAIRRAITRVSRRDLDRARAANDKLAEAGAAGDHWGVREANRAFHFGFYERCGVAALPERIEGLWLVFPWDLALVKTGVRWEASFAEHATLVEALAEGDADAAAEATAAHIRGGYLAVMEGLAGGPVTDPFPPDAD